MPLSFSHVPGFVPGLPTNIVLYLIKRLSQSEVPSPQKNIRLRFDRKYMNRFNDQFDFVADFQSHLLK